MRLLPSSGELQMLLRLGVTALLGMVAWDCAHAEPADPNSPPAPGNALFYFPTVDQPATPATWGYKYQDLRIPSTDGVVLSGWLIEPKRKATQGFVVFSHGAAGAMGHHLGFAMWWVDAGYRVVMYDYRGYGQSTGTIDRKGVVDDAIAVFQFTEQLPSAQSAPIISYGHSIGGATSIAALNRYKPKRLKAVVTDAAFSSYRAMARQIAGDFGENLVSDEFAPLTSIQGISPTPLLMIHGRKDPLVPVTQARDLYKAAKEPKTLIEIPNAGHGDALSCDEGSGRKRVLKWLGGT